jgi:hypothetical protein
LPHSASAPIEEPLRLRVARLHGRIIPGANRRV